MATTKKGGTLPSKARHNITIGPQTQRIAVKVARKLGKEGLPSIGVAETLGALIVIGIRHQKLVNIPVGEIPLDARQ
jgi:hypothetical protein